MKKINVLLLIIVLSSHLWAKGSKEKSIKLLPPSGNSIYFSAYPDFSYLADYNSTATIEHASKDDVSKNRIESFQKIANKKIAWATFDNEWHEELVYPKKQIETVNSMDILPLVRITPFNVNGKLKLKEIISGLYDDALLKWANASKKHKKPIALIFGHEMNGNWNDWSGSKNGGSKLMKNGVYEGPETFKLAYRHVIDVFRKAKVKHITWLFHCNILLNDENLDGKWNAPKNYYPGDDYIDWIGTSIYAPFNPKAKWWQTFEEILNRQDKSSRKAYEQLLDISSTKPLALLEFGVTDYHKESKSIWLKEAFEYILNNKNIRFQAINYWHENWDNNCKGTDKEKRKCITSLRIDSSKEVEEVFKELVQNKRFISEVNLSN